MDASTSDYAGGSNPNKRQRKEFSLREKREICIYKLKHPKAKIKDIIGWALETFGKEMGRSTMSELLKTSHRWINAPQSESRSRLRQGKYTDLENMLSTWWSEVTSHGLNPRDNEILEKAREIGDELNVSSLSYSKGWLHRFKARHAIPVVQRKKDVKIERAIEQAMLDAVEMNRGECDTNSKHQGLICEGLWTLRNDNMMCDMVLKVGEENIRAHRVVLSSCSRYLKTCCMYPLSFSDEGLLMLNVDRYSFKVCLRMLEYIYTGRLFSLPSVLREEFSRLASEWQIDLPGHYSNQNQTVESDEPSSDLASSIPGEGSSDNQLSGEKVGSELSRIEQEVGENCAHMMTGERGQKKRRTSGDGKEGSGSVASIREQEKESESDEETEEEEEAEEEEEHNDEASVSGSEGSAYLEEVGEEKPEIQTVNAENILSTPEPVYPPASSSNDITNPERKKETEEEEKGKDEEDEEAANSEDETQDPISSDEQSVGGDSGSSEVHFSIKVDTKQEKRVSPRLKRKTLSKPAPQNKKVLRGVAKKKNKKMSAAVAELKLRRQMPSLMNKYKMPHWCDECKLGFTAQNLLRGHNYECHWKEGMEMPNVYACPEANCDYKTYNRKSWFGHKAFVHPAEPSVCNLCQKSLKSSASLKQHMRFVHPEKPRREYNCGSCSRVFKSASGLQRHHENMHLESRQKHICPHCGLTRLNDSSIRDHMFKIHDILPPGKVGLKCKFCDYKCLKIVELNNHEARHYDEKLFQCDKCEKRYSTKRELNKHYQFHTKTYKVFKCPYCDYSSKYSRAALQDHILAKHEDDRPCVCSICGYSCKLKGNLHKHIRNVHKCEVQTRNWTLPKYASRPGDPTDGTEKTVGASNTSNDPPQNEAKNSVVPKVTNDLQQGTSGSSQLTMAPTDPQENAAKNYNTLAMDRPSPVMNNSLQMSSGTTSGRGGVLAEENVMSGAAYGYSRFGEMFLGHDGRPAQNNVQTMIGQGASDLNFAMEMG